MVVVDLVRDSVSSPRIAFDGIGHAGFAGPELLAISTAERPFSIQPSTLAYISF